MNVLDILSFQSLADFELGLLGCIHFGKPNKWAVSPLIGSLDSTQQFFFSV